MINLKPLNDRIVVRQINDPQMTSGGILLANSREEDTATGKVVAVGEGLVTSNGSRLPLLVEVGEIVIYHKFAGHEIVVDGEKLRVIQEHEVYAVIDE